MCFVLKVLNSVFPDSSKPYDASNNHEQDLRNDVEVECKYLKVYPNIQSWMIYFPYEIRALWVNNIQHRYFNINHAEEVQSHLCKQEKLVQVRKVVVFRLICCAFSSVVEMKHPCLEASNNIFKHDTPNVVAHHQVDRRFNHTFTLLVVFIVIFVENYKNARKQACPVVDWVL